jgi:hypothetical protein
MPSGSYKIDTGATFAAIMLMSSGPKLKFGTDQQDISQAGERKWEAQLVVTFNSDYPGMRPLSEVILVTITGGDHDPCQGVLPGTPVEVDGFQVGVSAPEARANGRGIMGGKPFYSARGIRPAGQSAARTNGAKVEAA